MRKAIVWDKIIFAITVYVFLSLNAKDLRLPAPELFRWILPMVLVFVAVIKREGRLALPPMLIILFVFALAPSFLDTPNFKDSLMKAISFIWIVYGCYIYFWACKDCNELGELFKILCAILLLFQGLSVLYILIGRGGGGSDGRYNGFLTNSNTLGIYSNLALCAAVYWVKRTKGFCKGFFVVMIILAVWLSIMSGSRSALIMVMINIIVFVFLQAKTTWAKILTLIIVVTLVALLFTGNLTFLKIKALDRLLEEGGSRDELWDYGLNVWKRFPIFGCGYRQSKVYNLLPGNEGMDFHNSYLSLLIEVGVWGVFVILLAILPNIINVGKYNIKEVKHNKDSCFIVATMMAISLMVNAWSESFMFSVGSTEAFAFWMLFVWLMSYLKKGDKQWVEWQ